MVLLVFSSRLDSMKNSNKIERTKIAWRQLWAFDLSEEKKRRRRKKQTKVTQTIPFVTGDNLSFVIELAHIEWRTKLCVFCFTFSRWTAFDWRRKRKNVHLISKHSFAKMFNLGTVKQWAKQRTNEWKINQRQVEWRYSAKDTDDDEIEFYKSFNGDILTEITFWRSHFRFFQCFCRSLDPYASLSFYYCGNDSQATK